MTAADDQSTPAARRRIRHDGGRKKPIKVLVNDDEYEQLSARAAACGLTVPSYLVLSGLQSLAAGSGPSMSPAQARALVAELYAVKRILRGSATNLNQLTKGANASGEIPDETWHHVERIARMERRLDEVLDALEPELKPRS